MRESFSIVRLLTIVNVVLVGSVAWFVGDVAALFVEHEYMKVPPQKAEFRPPQQKNVDRPRRFSEFQDILTYNVFDAEIATALIEKVEEVEVKATPGVRLNKIMEDFSLSGIHYMKGHYIYCIIKSKKEKREDIFTIGDELFQTGVVVKRIFTSFENQRVLLQLGNESGYLRYKVEEDKKPAPTSVSKKKAQKKSSSTSLTRASTYSTDGRNFYISATEVDSHLNDFGTLLNQARMVPYFKNKKHQGFRVKAIDKGSLYEKLGLRNNDVLKAVNGESLAEAGGEKLMGLFKLLRNEREFTVELERGGKSEILNYYIN